MCTIISATEFHKHRSIWDNPLCEVESLTFVVWGHLHCKDGFLYFAEEFSFKIEQRPCHATRLCNDMSSLQCVTCALHKHLGHISGVNTGNYILQVWKYRFHHMLIWVHILPSQLWFSSECILRSGDLLMGKSVLSSVEGELLCKLVHSSVWSWSEIGWLFMISRIWSSVSLILQREQYTSL